VGDSDDIENKEQSMERADDFDCLGKTDEVLQRHGNPQKQEVRDTFEMSDGA
jgi:hypothetical protein